MVTEEQLRILVRVKDMATAELARVGGAVSRLGAGVVAGMRGAIGALTSFKGLLLGLGAAGLARSLIRAADEQERAIHGFRFALQQAGLYTADFEKQLHSLASQIQKEGIIGDEAILEGSKFLLLMEGMSAQVLPRAMRVMADFAALTDKDVVGASRAVVMALEGEASMLSRYGIRLDETIMKSKDMGLILTELEGKVGGYNKAMAGTAAGGATAFRNALGELAEKGGELLRTALVPVLAIVTKRMQEANTETGTMKDRFQSAGEFIILALGRAADALNVVRYAVVKLAEGFTYVQLFAAKAFGWVIDKAAAVAEALHKAIAWLASWVGIEVVQGPAVEAIRSLTPSIEKVVKDIEADLAPLAAEASGLWKDILGEKNFKKAKADIAEWKKGVAEARAIAEGKAGISPGIINLAALEKTIALARSQGAAIEAAASKKGKPVKGLSAKDSIMYEMEQFEKYSKLLQDEADKIRKKYDEIFATIRMGLAQAVSVVSENLLAVFDDWVEGQLKPAREYIRDILRDLGKMAARMAINIITSAIAGASAAGGGIFNAFKAMIPAYGAGAILAANRPHLAVVGDNPRKQEAVIPMENGRIRAEVVGGGAPVINVHFSFPTMDPQTAAAGVFRVRRQIVDIVQGAARENPGEMRAAFGM